MALQIQDKIVQTFPEPNIAAVYGTYPTIAIANIAVEAANVKCAGLTVGIKDATTGVVTEYWYQPDDQGDLELVEKQKASSNIFGYYNPVDEKFYEEDTFATEITGDSDSIYIDVTTNAMYRWDVAESTFVLMNDQSGEKKVSGTVTHNYRKTITAEVGSYSNAEIVYNENWRYIDLYVHKNETVFYKAKEHRSGGSSQARTQPIAFVDSNGIVRLNPTGNYGEVMIDSYRALDDGVFTVNVRYDSGGWDDAYLYVIRTQGGGIDERVDGLITRVDALQGKDGIDFRKAAMDDSDTSAQDLNNRTNTIDLKQLYPWCNKFGNRIQLTCKVATMGILRFWFDTPGLAQADTPSVYDHRLLTIDDTYIKLYDMHDTTTAIDTVAHGLTIDGYLSVNLNCLDDGTMRVSINTLDSVMTIDGNDYCILTHWNYGVGRIKLVSDGCELTDVQLSVGNDMFRSPFWMFGASQEGLKDSRYAGQLKKMGYLNVLDNARSGRSSDYALDDLERALTFGQPKYLYFSLSNDGYEPSTYEARLQAVAELASEKGMTLIVMARAVHPQAAGDFNATPEQQLAKRNFIISIVQRVFDFGKAVSADPEDPEAIYEGYLDEAYLHPANAMAANAVAMQFLADVPEIMQYGGNKAIVQGGGSSPTELAVSTTYAALKALRDGGNLVPGTWYRITDYVCTTTQDNTQSAGHAFDIIVRADDASHLNENAYATHHEGDTYFTNCKLEAWELKYCLDNDTNRFAWADGTNGTGVVYWMKDEWDNEAPYDFKNIMFSRTLTNGAYDDHGTAAYVYTFNSYSGGTNSDASVLAATNNKIRCCNNVISEYRNTSSGDYKLLLNNIVFLNVYANHTGYTCSGNTFANNCYSNTFGNDCNNNTFGNGCNSNTFANNCYSNTFGNDCNINTFGNDCIRNSFGNQCYSNSFGNNCEANSFANNCYGNSLGNGCSANSFGNCNRNSFGYGCANNTFGNNCIRNTFGNHCQSITVFDSVQYCSVTGGASNAEPVKNAQILNGTAGASAQNKLTIAFAANKAYTQVAAKTTDGTLKIFNPADLVP